MASAAIEPRGPDIDEGSAYCDGYWDCDTLLQLGRVQRLSDVMLRALCQMAGTSYGSIDYETGFNKRLAESDGP